MSPVYRLIRARLRAYVAQRQRRRLRAWLRESIRQAPREDVRNWSDQYMASYRHEEFR